ncbi:hypothetical protein P0G10_20505, partial [Eubacteriales bacterium DFI.9.88]|nr:hypothetical protein [Eubacteriales bacterium DFI.9.88]
QNQIPARALHSIVVMGVIQNLPFISQQRVHTLCRLHGSIPAFLEKEKIKDGIIYSCVKHDVPFILNGSLRDDGPLPEVYEHTYVGQDAVRIHISKATT